MMIALDPRAGSKESARGVRESQREEMMIGLDPRAGSKESGRGIRES